MKKKKEPKVEKCFICKNPIYLKKEDYTNIKDFREGKFENELFCHRICWLEHLSNKKLLVEAKTKANELMKKIIQR